MKIETIEKLPDGSYKAQIQNGLLGFEVPFLVNERKSEIQLSDGFSKKTKEHIVDWIKLNELPQM